MLVCIYLPDTSYGNHMIVALKFRGTILKISYNIKQSYVKRSQCCTKMRQLTNKLDSVLKSKRYNLAE